MGTGALGMPVGLWSLPRGGLFCLLRPGMLFPTPIQGADPLAESGAELPGEQGVDGDGKLSR